MVVHPLYKWQFSSNYYYLKTLAPCKGIFGLNFSYGHSSNLLWWRYKSGATEWLTRRQFPYLLPDVSSTEQRTYWWIQLCTGLWLHAFQHKHRLGFQSDSSFPHAPCPQTVQFYCLCVLDVNDVYPLILRGPIYSNIIVKESKDEAGPLSVRFSNFFPQLFQSLIFHDMQSTQLTFTKKKQMHGQLFREERGLCWRVGVCDKNRWSYSFSVCLQILCWLMRI